MNVDTQHAREVLDCVGAILIQNRCENELLGLKTQPTYDFAILLDAQNLFRVLRIGGS